MDAMLDPEQSEHLTKYLEAERRGMMSEIEETLDRFIFSLESQPMSQWQSWSFDLAHRLADGVNRWPTVRLPLFKRILFPALYEGLLKEQPGCARWLAAFSHLLYHAPECAAQLGIREAEPMLLRTALAHDRTDSLARRRLIQQLAWDLEYYFHELPFCVLGGEGYATADECDVLITWFEDFAHLVEEEGIEDKYGEILSAGRYHLKAWKRYLEHEQTTVMSYEDYCEAERVSRIELLRTALKSDEADSRTRKALIQELADHFDHCISVARLPRCVRFEPSPSLTDTFRILSSEFDEFERLLEEEGIEGLHDELVAQCRFSLQALNAYLGKSELYADYEDFLKNAFPGYEDFCESDRLSRMKLLRAKLLKDNADFHTRRKLITNLAGHLKYSLHNLPHSVVFGPRPASSEQCNILSAELSEFERLIEQESAHNTYDLERLLGSNGTEGLDEGLIDECRYHFEAYRNYLEQKKGFATYRDYLACDRAARIPLLRTEASKGNSDSRTRKELMRELGLHFQHSLSGLPHCVLFGQTAASIDQCGMLRNQFDEFERLITTEKNIETEHIMHTAGVVGNGYTMQDFLANCAYHFDAYRRYREREGEFRSYQDFLDADHA